MASHLEDERITATLRPTAHFDFKRSLESLQVSGAGDLSDEISTENGWLQRPVKLNGQGFLVRVDGSKSSPEEPQLTVTLLAADENENPPTAQDLEAAVENLNRRFCLDLNMDEVREALAVNEYGEQLVAKFWPSRPANLPGAWEGLIKTVLSVQIYPGLAKSLQQALLDFYGEKVHFEGKAYHLFPTVEKLANVLPEELLPLRFSRQKAKYIPGIAEMIFNEPEKYDWERLRSVSGEEASATLDALPGVGVWTASYCAMRALAHPDVFIDEEGLRKTLSQAYDRRAVISQQEANKLVEVFKPFRSFACYYTYMLMYNA